MVPLTLLSVLITLLAGYMIWRNVKNEPRSMWLGTWTLVFLFFLLISIMLLASFVGGPGLLVMAEVVLMIIAIFVIASIVIDLGVVYYSWKIWRKESHTLANLLLPLLFLAMAVFNIVDGIMNNAPAWLDTLFTAARVMTLYFMVVFLIFFVSSIIYGWVMKKRESDYYVVLGAGLIDDHKVGKLLANRIQAATDAGKRRFEKDGKYPVIVFSGGQGGDEKISEAQAMRDYAVETFGYPAEQTRLEDQSRTTRENMRFSRDLISKETGVVEPSFEFFTSEYHVFRAGLQAREFGIEAQGRGGKTPFYYRIPAFIREYIAVLNMHRRLHIAISALVIGVSVILAIATLFVK